MASLKVKTGTIWEAKNGSVTIEGQCVVLWEVVNHKTGVKRMIYGYCLLPGETVRSEGDKYIVEY